MSDDEFNRRYKKLNKAQKQAVDTIEGPVLVVAGPGSGKTEILSLRVANILRKTDVYASNVLCLTFTDAAEINMRKRLGKIIGSEAHRVPVHTFHNLARDIRNRYPDHFAETAFFSVADNIVRTEILEEIFTELPHDDILRSEHPDLGFVFLNSVLKAIQQMKKGGLSPDEFSSVLDANEQFIDAVREDVNDVFSTRVSKSIFPEIESLLKDFEKEQVASPVPQFRSLGYSLSARLQRALDEAQSEESTKPISEFKRVYTKKSDNRRILKSDRDMDKLRSLAKVYAEYEQAKYKQGYYDFDDMILEVVYALEQNDDLRAEVAEQFQYILVDEFQDTNDAQMRLLLAMTGDVPEGDPNLMAVGDDDQAIYRFQGAEVSNILQFKHRFRDPKLITLVNNYRSHQDVLEVARSVIVQGAERLEQIVEEIEKELVASGEAADSNVVIEHHVLSTHTHHNHSVVKQVERCLEDGVPPEEIAVLGRRHRDLESLVPHFHEAQIPISYERQQNVLQEPHIRQLITMCRFVASVAGTTSAEADEYLPDILAFPFWELKRDTIWKLSLQARREDKTWLELMQESDNSKLSEIADFFLAVAARAKHEPVEQILDLLIGRHKADSDPGSDSPDADEIELPSENHIDFVSPFKEYYFSQEKFDKKTPEYLRFLSSLKRFVRALREHKQDTLLLTDDLLFFVDTHENNRLVVTDTSPFVGADGAINLLTAHSAKGQEFDAVIIVGAVNDIWANSSSRNRISFPENLPIEHSGDTLDDQLRLLYVALTRARSHLYIMSFEIDDTGSEKVPLSFLEMAGIPQSVTSGDAPSTHVLLETTVPTYHGGPYVKEEEALLKPLVEDYHLSVTHLNNFLDVRYGGPQQFVRSNLLRFPQPLSRSAVYGRAIHESLERAYQHVKKTGDQPDTEMVLEWFSDQISRSRLSTRDREYLRERGTSALKVYWPERKAEFKESDLSEYSFRGEGAAVGDVPIVGKIDKMVREDDLIRVHDFKTGSSFDRWSNSYAKSLQYQRQLIFYKLLVENSRSFSDCRVEQGVVEFIEPDDGEVVILSYDIEEEAVERLIALCAVVHERITNLSFPDTSGYKESAKGIRQFEDDLLDGNV